MDCMLGDDIGCPDFNGSGDMGARREPGVIRPPNPGSAPAEPSVLPVLASGDISPAAPNSALITMTPSFIIMPGGRGDIGVDPSIPFSNFGTLELAGAVADTEVGPLGLGNEPGVAMSPPTAVCVAMPSAPTSAPPGPPTIPRSGVTAGRVFTLVIMPAPSIPAGELQTVTAPPLLPREVSSYPP